MHAVAVISAAFSLSFTAKKPLDGRLHQAAFFWRASLTPDGVSPLHEFTPCGNLPNAPIRLFNRSTLSSMRSILRHCNITDKANQLSEIKFGFLYRFIYETFSYLSSIFNFFVKIALPTTRIGVLLSGHDA